MGSADMLKLVCADVLKEVSVAELCSRSAAVMKLKPPAGLKVAATVSQMMSVVTITLAVPMPSLAPVLSQR